MVESGEIGPGETIVFWHTGGAPALFAYAEELMTRGMRKESGPPAERASAGGPGFFDDFYGDYRENRSSS